jgi:hypothetical protein
VLWVVTTIATAWVQPEVLSNLLARPWSLACALTSIGGFCLIPVCLKRERELGAFLGSCAFLLGLMAALDDRSGLQPDGHQHGGGVVRSRAGADLVVGRDCPHRRLFCIPLPFAARQGWARSDNKVLTSQNEVSHG